MLNDLEYGLRSVNADSSSSHGFVRPAPGKWATATGPFTVNGNPCPSVPGDGLCVARSWSGAASGAISGDHILLVGYRPNDVLADDRYNKLRVKSALVIERFKFRDLINEANSGELQYLNLSNVLLIRADLSDTNLQGSNISGARLTGANLTVANLTGANLTDAKGA